MTREEHLDSLNPFLKETEDNKSKFKVGDIVFVSNPDLEYEKEYGIREHKSFFGRIIEVEEYTEEICVTVYFPITPNGCDMEWSYDAKELSLASELKDMTLEEFSNKYGVSVLAEYLS